MQKESTSKPSTKEFPRRWPTMVMRAAMLALAVFCGLNRALGEGSGAWGVTDNRQVNLFVPATASSGGGNTGYVARGFMMLASNTGTAANPYNPAHRMYVWVKANETVFYGFRTSSGNTTVNFNWYYDNTSTGYYPTATTSPNRVLAQAQGISQNSGGATGRPSNAAAATAGPSQVTGSGYTAYSFVNTTGADRAFWVEIESNNLEFNYWDVTVASGTAGNYTRQNGRLYCKYWSVVNDLPTSAGSSGSTSSPSNFGFYIPIDNTYTPAKDFYVKYANFGGSSSGYAIFFANLDGPRNNLTFEQNRRSINGVSSNAHFPLFLSNPDATVWPSPPLPVATFEAVFSRRPGSSPAAGQASFAVNIDNPSIVDILIDLNGNGYYDGNDVILSNEYNAAGNYQIYWDGKDRNGADVPSGTAIHFVSSLLFYPVHFPIYDMEQSLGISIKHVRPLRSGTQPINDKLYWDDTGITRANIPSTSTLSPRSVQVNVTGVLGPDHKWWANGDNGFSQNNTINTWTGAYNDEIVRELIFNYTSDVDLAVTKTVSPGITTVGETVTFTIQATNVPLPENAGNPITATGVIVTDEVPDGYTVENVSVSKGSWDEASDTWTIGTLAENEVVTMTVTAKVNAAGPYLNTAIVQGNENDDNQTNNKDDALVVFPPVATDDQDLRNAPGSIVTLNIIGNDKLGGGSVPAVGEVTVDLDPSTSDIQHSLSVSGEGVWTYANGEVTFTPETGVTSNPTPINYTLTEIATSLTDVATITVTYLHVPNSDDHSTSIGKPVVDQIIPLNGTGGNPPLFSGSDAEDGTYSGKTGTNASPQGVIIASLPTNGELYYDGSLVTSNEVSTARVFPDPSLFSLKMTGAGYSKTSFEYAYVDADGLADASPATYTLTWEGALPVTLVGFEAVLKENQVFLSWKTAEETNASHFDVERSNDARNWNKIAETAAVGDSRQPTSYTAIDEAPLSGIIYYRLKTVDRDNTFAYSRAVSVNLGNAGFAVRVYPNPASYVLHINGVEPKSVSHISLANASGQIVAQFDTVPEKGIDLSQLSSGMYLVKIVTKDGLQTVRKIVVSR